MLKRVTALFIFILVFSQILAGCGKTVNTTDSSVSNPKENTASSAETSGEPKKVTQVLDWFPQPTHGGLYTAQVKDFYKENNLDVTIQPGGPQVSPVQIVSSGQAEFGLASADSILLAREQGIPIVGVAALLQKSPSALFYHKGDSIQSFADLNGRKVYAHLPATYWKYLKHTYKLDRVEEFQFNGQYTNFINDKKSLTQGYTTNTPSSLKKENVEVESLLVADSGYEPYYSIIFTTEKYLKENPDIVKAYVAASIKGWDFYKDHIEVGSEALKEVNKDASLEELNDEAKLQKEFVYGGEAAENGVGYMSLERWQTLNEQLHEIGELKKNEDVQKAFTTEFLPEK
ncbi:ABC transporter substrate-binding protein [Metabacillus fastidiosus]|uniref:ABC transporter substrate-binding protein n=1 Tax=Metabacillus fastidiosus TaxID=1458 RepID=A0ABU6P242_9BACI|nr:ABC transporter substrate-binding protein [Metabacillus fastidiosus]MED4403430.1 ABC transporter substrate-binding protein [Metabacillus fastidiosus]MED4454026.1 ABC transporter substrate-binding protein [Metabacillus fastidiosus]MED4460784.1 ABC transporter substrate-binding protein [Metabacillus fastidiosus]